MCMQALRLVDLYGKKGIDAKSDRLYIKIASTWEGIRACEILQKQGIDTNMTLIFSFAQVSRLLHLHHRCLVNKVVQNTLSLGLISTCQAVRYIKCSTNCSAILPNATPVVTFVSCRRLPHVLTQAQH